MIRLTNLMYQNRNKQLLLLLLFTEKDNVIQVSHCEAAATHQDFIY